MPPPAETPRLKPRRSAWELPPATGSPQALRLVRGGASAT